MKAVILTMIACALILAGCVAVPKEEAPVSSPMSTSDQSILMEIEGQSFPIQLEDTLGATEFKSRLPMTITMEDLQKNEKYYYLPYSLPTSPTAPGHIQAGDLMLYGDDCLVLFYESFSSTYSYTPLGRVQNVNGLKEALRDSKVEVTYYVKE